MYNLPVWHFMKLISAQNSRQTLNFPMRVIALLFHTYLVL